MRNRLHDLSIRRKFAVVLVPLVLTILVFDYFQIRDSFLDYKDSTRLNKAIIVGIEINHVVHEIQKERGITSGYLSAKGESFAQELMAQRERTDSTLQVFYREVNDPRLDDVMQIHGKDIEDLKTYFNRLSQIRSQVDDLTLTPNRAIEYFSDINGAALNTVNDLINETRDKTLAQQVHAIIYFLKSKERTSIERAMGTQVFAVKRMDNDMYNTYSSLVSAQESYLDAFLTITNEESREYFERIVKGPDVDEARRLQQVLLTNRSFDEDPSHFYNVLTGKINSLKMVEDFMSDRIHNYTETVAASANREFVLFVVIDLVVAIITFLLVGSIVRNIVSNVNILEAFTKKIAAGDLSDEVHVSARDELGHYADTFNVMVEEINKSHAELKKERDQAEYLYENIYKQSEVVFENVHQGIFLLDKDFKISNLYSRAMEDIFEQKKIGGENFGNFMRPHIIPRDLEALEMFMKHLFNKDMDEEVVNQLNPVEQVKIFTEADGIVNTKYIRVSFTRIERNGEIQSIMATISDETESVLLQQHLEEAEEKKKRETEQVLSILKIDPAVLQGFLHNSKKIIKGISERYEANKGRDLKELMNFTFETIHNLKGNAMVIGLDLMREKFHLIEESIAEFKEKDVAGKDFLTILYEIDEANKILEDMEEMLHKVASVYKNLPSEGQLVTNIMLLDTLEKGLEKMSKELDKPVSLTFKNEKNLVIPDNLINPFKDVMIQLMRNSLSHGIESANVRVALDKMVKGNIIVSVDRTDQNEMIISYCDDGKGLDIEEIATKAVEREIITEASLEDMSDEEIARLIFNNGFSTAGKADDYSGRGQGMSLVKTIIEENGGAFDINFVPGQFFEMNMRLPLLANQNEPIEAAS